VNSRDAISVNDLYPHGGDDDVDEFLLDVEDGGEEDDDEDVDDEDDDLDVDVDADEEDEL
jgi:hypothetical protein